MSQVRFRPHQLRIREDLMGHSATLDQSGIAPENNRPRAVRNRGHRRPGRLDRRSSAERRYDTARSRPSRFCSALRACSSPAYFPPPERSGISGRIDNRGHHDRAGDLFDASGWNTARHLVRPRWVVGRSHAATPADITETDLGAGPSVHPRRPGRVRACHEALSTRSTGVGRCGKLRPVIPRSR